LAKKYSEGTNYEQNENQCLIALFVLLNSHMSGIMSILEFGTKICWCGLIQLHCYISK